MLALSVIIIAVVAALTIQSKSPELSLTITVVLSVLFLTIQFTVFNSDTSANSDDDAQVAMAFDQGR